MLTSFLSQKYQKYWALYSYSSLIQNYKQYYSLLIQNYEESCPLPVLNYEQSYSSSMQIYGTGKEYDFLKKMAYILIGGSI